MLPLLFITVCLRKFLLMAISFCKTLSCKVTSKFTIMNFDLQPFHLSLRKVFENEIDKK